MGLVKLNEQMIIFLQKCPTQVTLCEGLTTLKPEDQHRNDMSKTPK